jgi:hypothetical protein
MLITRNRNGSHITVRYLDSTSSSVEGGWGYHTMHARTLHALTTVEEIMELAIMELAPRGNSRGENTSVFREYSPGASSERVLQRYSFDDDYQSGAGDESKFDASSSSGVEFQPFTYIKRGLKRSAKEIVKEQRFSLTAMSPKKGEESSSSEPSSVTSRGGSDSEESDRYSPTSPRKNRHHRFFDSPTEEDSMAPVKKAESSSSPRKESSSPPRSSAKDKRENTLKGKTPAAPRNVPVHDWKNT